jgi:HSP20 family protein
MQEELKKKKIDDLIDFENLEKLMDDLMKSLQESEGRADNAQVFGVSIKISKDGKPVMQKIGESQKEFSQAIAQVKPKEPLVDVRQDSKNFFLVAEMPGILKEDIDVRLNGLELSISSASGEFFKKISLPFAVEEMPEKSAFNNGILELAFKRKIPEAIAGKKINVE